MKHRSVLHSPKLQELKKRRRRAFFKRTLFWLFIIGGMLWLSSYLSRAEGLNIYSIRIEGESIVEEAAIRGTAEEELSGKYAWLFPKTNVLLFPKRRIGELLAERYKRLDDIELSVTNDRVLLIRVTERNPAYLWCENTAADQCYFMDAKGYIFDKAPYFSEGVYFKWTGTVGVKSSSPAGSYYARDYFANLVSFKDAVKSLGLMPVSLRLSDIGDAELLLKRTVSEPKIVFRAADDAGHLAENLAAALETEPLKTRIKKDYGKLEYLDLRFDNKVFSKFMTI